MRSCSRPIDFAAQADEAPRVQPQEQTTSQLGLAVMHSSVCKCPSAPAFLLPDAEGAQLKAIDRDGIHQSTAIVVADFLRP